MKIAIISSGFLPVVDGVTVSLYHRLRSLSQRGHQVLVLCPD
ncbi:MAG: glycosyltransferase family 1 protein, partial [Okeania sp. SIO2G5]|nr:glycosyltransferase family 1 protein [Okeania sp. SIO2G5]